MKKSEIWTIWAANSELHDVLVKYKAPQGEAAIAKGLPIALLPLMKELNKFVKVRAAFRGPRYGSRYNCAKANATHFSIYQR